MILELDSAQPKKSTLRIDVKGKDGEVQSLRWSINRLSNMESLELGDERRAIKIGLKLMETAEPIGHSTLLTDIVNRVNEDGLEELSKALLKAATSNPIDEELDGSDQA